MRWKRIAVVCGAIVLGGLVAHGAAADEASDEGVWRSAVFDETLDWDATAEEIEALEDDRVAEAEAEGATVREVRCVIFDQRLFTRELRTSGHLVVTPSGNATLVCHAHANLRVVRAVPSEAVVLEDAPCSVGRLQFRDSQLVLTPSLRVVLVCHSHPPG